MRIETVEELKELPNGAVFVSEPDCLWSGRYAGVKWKKENRLTIKCLQKTDNWGFRKDRSVTYLPSFKDPLPVRVLEYENEV